MGLWHNADLEPSYSEYLELDLATVEPSLAGPKRPQDRVRVADAQVRFREALTSFTDVPSQPTEVDMADGARFTLDHGSVVIAAITSCTNTSNPWVMVAAALVAKKAVEHGWAPSPGSKRPWLPAPK